MKKILLGLSLLFAIQLNAQHGPNSQNNTHQIPETQLNTAVANFDITEDTFVNLCINAVQESNIANTIVALQNYGTRFHTKASGVQASHDLKNNWQNMVSEAGRTDITVEEFSHNFSNQVSVILTIPGAVTPDEIIIIGGHLDSGDYWIQDNAPGADDNASGIATLTETLRVLLDHNFQPQKTVQIMAYAAEEIGLFGSADIAQNYKDNDKNVLAVLQFDMTNYKGSDFDIALNNDTAYISPELNLFLIELLEHYNAEGEHKITYGSSKCNYACSDHASWGQRGFAAAFPMEAKFEESNPNIHTTNDTFEAMGSTAEHSVKFVKLALEFVIETGKQYHLKTSEVNSPVLKISTQNKTLTYQFSHLNNSLQSVAIYNAAAQKITDSKHPAANGSISLDGTPGGVYTVIFKDSKGKSWSKRFIIK